MGGCRRNSRYASRDWGPITKYVHAGFSTKLCRLTKAAPARPGSDSHARELNAHTDSQVDAGVKLEDKGEEPRPAKRFIEKATETTENAPTSAENISVATVKTPVSKELSTTNKSKTPFRPGVLEGRFIRNPAISQQTTKRRQPLKMNAVSIHATANSYDGLKMPRLPIHKLKPLRNLVTMTLEDVPRPLRQSFDKPIFLNRVNTLSYGMKHDRELNGGWCYKELCTDQICPLGEECPYSHCPPDRNTCLWLLQVDTRARDNIHHRLARGFLFNCFNNYWQKYYQFGLCPILSPLQRGVPMSRLSDDAQPVQLAFERPDDIFESEKCKDIIDEWQFLNDLHATITQTFNPTAPVRSGIQSNTRNSQGAGTESKRAAASETTSIEQL
jgi:hypothetical protein